MIRSLQTAEQAMQKVQVRIDALANNLANANSTGFRQILTRVTSGLDQDQGGAPAVRQQTSSAWPRFDRLDLTHALDTRPGPVSATGRDTDVAILGKGYFVVQTPDGERYTRNGSFLLNEQQQLVTPAGEPVLGEGGPLTLDGGSFSIEQDGTVMVDGNAAGRLRLVDFADATRLEHQGANLLTAPAGMAAAPVPAAEVVVAQGQLEGSNVNPIDTLVAMIEAQRAFEIHAKIMSTEDEMLNKSVNNLPRTTA